MSDVERDPLMDVIWTTRWVTHDQHGNKLAEPSLALEAPLGEIMIVTQAVIDQLQEALTPQATGHESH